ncbi:MAG: class I SAM-dependent methyltransferase [Gemmatimonadota bacterium]
MNCAACGSGDVVPWAHARDVEYQSVPDTFAFVRCRACGALSLEHPPTDRLDRIYPENYYSFAAADDGAVQHVKDWLDRRWFRSVTRKLPGAALSALDVGGGSGHQLDALRRADRRVARTVVVDLDRGAEAAAVAAGHEFVRARIEDADLRGPFDVILVLNLIEHVADPGAVLRRVRDLVSPTGMILVKTPNIDSLDARVFRHRNWGGYHCPRHWVLFTQESFASAARRAGLRVRSWSYTQGAPFWTVSILAWLDAIGATRVNAQRPAWQHPLYAPLAAVFAAFDFLRRPVSRLSQMTFALTQD